MKFDDLLALYDMDYFKLCLELQNKYGIPSKPYMTISKSGNWRKTSGISRTKEGLYIHHIDEWDLPRLSKVEIAQNYSIECQEPQNLCYCNLLEHLVLHFIIEKVKNRDGTNDNFGSAVIHAQIMTSDNCEFRDFADRLKLKYQMTDFFDGSYWLKWEDINYSWKLDLIQRKNK